MLHSPETQTLSRDVACACHLRHATGCLSVPRKQLPCAGEAMQAGASQSFFQYMLQRICILKILLSSWTELQFCNGMPGEQRISSSGS